MFKFVFHIHSSNYITLTENDFFFIFIGPFIQIFFPDQTVDTLPCPLHHTSLKRMLKYFARIRIN